MRKFINFSPYGLYVSYLQYYAWCAMLLNGFTFKDPKMVEASDFSNSGLDHIAGNTSNPAVSKVSPMTSTQIPGTLLAFPLHVLTTHHGVSTLPTLTLMQPKS